MTARLVPYLVAAFWLAAYLVGGIVAVIFVAVVGIVGELVLFTAAEMQDEADECADRRIAEQRWQRWQGERAA